MQSPSSPSLILPFVLINITVGLITLYSSSRMPPSFLRSAGTVMGWVCMFMALIGVLILAGLGGLR